MQILSRYDQFCKLWELTLPSVPLPPSPTIMGWLGGFDDAISQRVLLHALRGRPQGADHEATYKNVSKQLRERCDWQRQNQRTTC